MPNKKRFNAIFNNIKDSKYIYYLIIIFIALVLLSPILYNYINGHDSLFHISNIYAIKQSISLNRNYPRIIPIIAKNFGYATPMFYGPLSHLITAIISLIIDNFRSISLLHIMSLVHFLVLSLSGIFFFQFSNKLLKNKNLSLLSTIIYMTFPYHLSEIFVRDAYAESMTFIFIPLIFNGLYELLECNNKKKFYLLFIFGVCGLILTHTITTLFTAIIVGIFLLINWKKTFKKTNIISLIIAFLLILCISAFYLFPLLEQKIMGNYHVFAPNSMASIDTLSYQALEVKLLFPFLNNNRDFDGIQFFILMPVIVLFMYSIISFRKTKVNYKNIFLFSIISTIILLIATSKIFPWKLAGEGLFTYIQFPWRLLVFVTFFMSLSSVICLKQYDDKIIEIISFVLIIIILTISLNSLNLTSVKDYTLDSVNMSVHGVGFNKEYFPEKLVENYDYYENRSEDVIILKGDTDAAINIEEKMTPYLKLKANCKKETLVELPLIYYYGYKMNISNEYISVEEGKNGFINAKLPKGENTIIVDYVGTNLQKTCNVVSIFGIIIFSSLLVLINKKNVKFLCDRK